MCSYIYKSIQLRNLLNVNSVHIVDLFKDI
ncbi:UNVERIFIED_CONTAM: hypothetical protein GTU68_005490 [Idotea baltica]|nr:hypothetical protein [Idotea baltica]